jgi:hypothetical protein
MTRALFLLMLAVFLSSCASIVSDSAYDIRFTCDPSNATVKIVDLNGAEVYNGEVPATVQLEAGARFFKRQRYTLTFSAPGYMNKTLPLQCKVDGWYWGNLLLGGVIGMLIVDPATGAMYKFNQEYVSTTLKAEDTSMLSIQNIDALSRQERLQLETIGKLPKEH